jgi:hypothetical protein
MMDSKRCEYPGSMPFSTGRCYPRSLSARTPTLSPVLYDPAGSYTPKKGEGRGSGDIIFGPGADLSDFTDYHEGAGEIVEYWCFETSCCEEKQIVDRALELGGTAPFFCGSAVGKCISGIGPFGDVSGFFTGPFRRRIKGMNSSRNRTYP